MTINLTSIILFIVNQLKEKVGRYIANGIVKLK